MLLKKIDPSRQKYRPPNNGYLLTGILVTIMWWVLSGQSNKYILGDERTQLTTQPTFTQSASLNIARVFLLLLIFQVTQLLNKFLVPKPFLKQ